MGLLVVTALAASLVCASAASADAQDPGPSAQEAALARQLRPIDQHLLIAITTGDRQVWADVIGPGFSYIAENEQAIDGPTLLSLLKPPKPGDEGADVAPFRIVDYTVHLAGDTAVILHHDAEQGMHLGSPLTGIDVTTEVWQLIGGAWKLRLVHTTPIPTVPPAVTVPQAEIAPLLGRYRAGEEGVTLSVSGAGLKWQADGRAARRLDAEARDVWFEPSNPRIRYIFRRDGSGRVVEVLRRNENRAIVYSHLAGEGR